MKKSGQVVNRESSIVNEVVNRGVGNKSKLRDERGKRDEREVQAVDEIWHIW
jgi:hypothetical protein